MASTDFTRRFLFGDQGPVVQEPASQGRPDLMTILQRGFEQKRSAAEGATAANVPPDPLDNPSLVHPGLDRVGEMQGDLGSRLGLLRENRQFLSNAAAQPFMQQISEQEGFARRQVGLEGSLGDRRRSDIANQADLARQNVRSQAFGQQIQSEQGLLQLQNDFSAMFNEMANTQFSQALSGLGEEIDRYMAEKGRDLKYADLATKAQATSNRMMGRLAGGLASAFEDNDDSGLQR